MELVIMFTRQHYVKIAEVMALCNATDKQIEQFVKMFERDNPNFKPQTFKGAIAAHNSPMK